MNELIDKLFASVIKPRKHYLINKIIRVKKDNMYSYWEVISTNPYSTNLFLITPVTDIEDEYIREEFWFNIKHKEIQEIIVCSIPNN